MSISALVNNPIELRAGIPFAAIIGLNPSKGARSPLLWNAAFAAHGSPSVMIPLDVAADGLTTLLDALDAEADFVGGAVAMPHKEAIAAWLGDRIEPEAAKIGAVNCLFRRDGRLWGTNTDGAAAQQSLMAVRDLSGARVVLLGPGGAGKAVAAYLAAAGARLTLVARDGAKVADFAAAIAADVVAWPPSPALLAATDVVVNCASIGSAAAGTAAESPLSDHELAALPADAVVYDIIYDPAPTVLLSRAAARGLRTLDGAEMNLLQAVLAFGFAAAEPYGADLTQSSMLAAKSAGTPPSERLLGLMSRNLEHAKAAYVAHHKSRHWDVFPPGYAQRLANAAEWPNFRNNGLSGGFDTSMANPTVAPILQDARTVEYHRRMWRDLTAIVGEAFVRRFSETSIGNPPCVVDETRTRLNVPDLRHIHNLWQLQNWIGDADKPVLCEIGGGYGGLAAKMKRRWPNATVIVFDLPEVTAVQTYYLSTLFPDARIFVLEDLEAGRLPDLLAGKYDFALLPGWHFADLPAECMDAVVNARSMMEMSIDTVRFYFDCIHRAVKPNGLFYCINRYWKPIGDEANAIKSYPFDDRWMAIHSSPAWGQQWIHELAVLRTAVPNAFPLRQTLADLPPWSAKQLICALRTALVRLVRVTLGDHPSINPGLRGTIRNARRRLERRLVEALKASPELYHMLRRLRKATPKR